MATDQVDEKIERLSAALRAADNRVVKLETSNAALARENQRLSSALADALAGPPIEAALCSGFDANGSPC